MMADDETATVARVVEMRRNLRRLAGVCGGCVLDAVGDNVLAEFVREAEAFSYCAAVQRWLASSRDRAAGTSGIRVRIGVHSGDVLAGADGVFGTTLNITARLQSIAPTDGIVASAGTVAALTMTNRPCDVAVKELGLVALRNIPDPIALVAVHLSL